jgi:ribosomal 50S subunit-recycling heat shock protein
VSEDTCRLDVWLWRARLFKTRSSAAARIEEGRIRLSRGGETRRVEKPARAVKVGDRLAFALEGRLIWLEIQALGRRRGPPAEARELYTALDNESPAETIDKGAAPLKNTRPLRS